jgi:hypothetical protein
MDLRALVRLPRPPDLEELLLGEIGRARVRVTEVKRTFPSESQRQHARRLIEKKKQLARTGGAFAGLLGLGAIPADLALVAYLQLSLVVDIAVLHGVNLKGASGRAELLDVLGLDTGRFSALIRAAPLVASRLSRTAMREVGWRMVGRVVPVLAAPVSAWLNARDIHATGEAALRRFDTFRRARLARPGARDTSAAGT